MTGDRVRRVQELRRGSAAGPQTDTPTRSAAERAAIGEQLADADSVCAECGRWADDKWESRIPPAVAQRIRAALGLPGPLPRTLADDEPEPAIGSIVLDRDSLAWQRVPIGKWAYPGHGELWDWAEMIDRRGTPHGPYTLIHEGTGQ